MSLLPEWLRAALKRAAALPDKRERQLQIEKLTEQARRQYPDRFRPDKHATPGSK